MTPFQLPGHYLLPGERKGLQYLQMHTYPPSAKSHQLRLSRRLPELQRHTVEELASGRAA